MNPLPLCRRPSPRSHCRTVLLVALGVALVSPASFSASQPNSRRARAREARALAEPQKGATALTQADTAAAPAVPDLPPPTPVQVVVNATEAPETPESTPKAAPAVVTSPEAPLPLSPEVAERRLYSFRATDLELKAALAMFARANDLNIVPDRDVSGQVTLDVRDLSLAKVMQALLESYDYVWENEDGLIRVRARQTREFWIDYLRLSRRGSGNSSAMLASGMSGGSGGGGGGGGGGASSGGSTVNLTAENPVNFWTELREEIGRLLTVEGRDSLAINMTAGILQITDRPSALKRVQRYLEGLSGSVARQVEIRARIFDVTLRDQFQFGINWEHAAEAFGGVATMGGSTIVTAPMGGVPVKDSAFNFLFQTGDSTVLLEALQEQGEVNVVSQPRIRVVNNQTAMIKVGTETPFFTSRTTLLPGSTQGTTTTVQEDEVSTITIGTILAITPQISSNEWITLDVSPVLTSLVETRVSPSEITTAPVLDIKQASTLVRCKSGMTIIIGGLMQDEHGKTVRKIPFVGDIPLLGHLFRGTVDYTAKKELVISITPVIVE